MSIAKSVIEGVFRQESGRILATLVRAMRDFELADDAMQDAFAEALEHWPDEGIPDHPDAWIITTARRKAIDRLRRRRVARSVPLGAGPGGGDHGSQIQPSAPETISEVDERLDSTIPDERLRLIFTCCHPALSREAQVALTLRTLGGLTTPQIARAFLVPVETLAQRITRAKQKIRDAGIPYEIPGDLDLPERVGSVLAVLYLIFNEGYAAGDSDELLRFDLCDEAIRLARTIAELLPDEPEALGLLALVLLQDSRRKARTSTNGDLVLLEDQDRTLWDKARIAEGLEVLDRAERLRRPGAYQVQAAIAAVHAEAPSSQDTNWSRIVEYYDALLRLNPTPVVALNRAVAVGEANGPNAALSLLAELEAGEALSDYPYFYAAQGEFLRRKGCSREARTALERAISLTSNARERKFLAARLSLCSGPS